MVISSSEQQLSKIFHAMAHSTRRRILERLGAGDCTVGELAAPFDMSLAAVSKHLKVLEQATLVARERRGRQQICRLRPGGLKPVAACIAHYERLWNLRLDALENLLASDDA